VSSERAAAAHDDAPDEADPGPSVTPRERRDLGFWLIAGALGLGLTWIALRVGAQLGTQSAPFLGRYRWALGFGTILAPAVACAVLLAGYRGWFNRLSFRALLLTSYCATFAWALALALVDGAAGLTRSLESKSNYIVDVPHVGADPIAYLGTFTAHAGSHSVAARGHPPGPVLLMWALHRIGLTELLVLGILVAAIGALLTPLVLSAVRGVCGEIAARGYAPVLILAPYAVWVAVSVDVVVAVLGAAAMAAGVRASDKTRHGPAAGLWALAAGFILGLAALFSYAAPWLGLSLVCLYFARRRPSLNLATGVGALLPVGAAQLAGFGWLDGLLVASTDYSVRIEANRSYWWWAVLSLVALLFAAGPPLWASLRKVRNTPAWPFLVGAGTAVAFSVLYGLARGGVEAAWLPFFPWLTIAAVAPERQGGTPVPSPLLLAGGGAVTAIVVEAVLATPW
jgi:hypothetical protein